MTEAIHAYHSVTATETFRNLEWMRQKAAHDEAQALANARQQEREVWQGVAEERDMAVAERDVIATERDAALAEIEKLRQQLTRLTSED